MSQYESKIRKSPRTHTSPDGGGCGGKCKSSCESGCKDTCRAMCAFSYRVV